MFTATGTIVFLLVASALVSLTIHVVLTDGVKARSRAVVQTLRAAQADSARLTELERRVTTLAARGPDVDQLESLRSSLFAQDMRLCTLGEELGAATSAIGQLEAQGRERDESLRQTLAAASEEDARDLKRIKGIGAVMEKTLHEAGVLTIDQLANMTIDQIEVLSENLGRFADRIERDQWIEQAKALTQG